MNFIQQCMRWDPTPLSARIALAMARVLAPLDPEQSTELRNHAQDLAVDIGEHAEDRGQVPALLADEEWLVQAFIYGQDRAAHWEEVLALHPPTVWSDKWQMDLDGVFETRASVAKSKDGFLPGFEVSMLGGDCDPSHGSTVTTLEQAIELAKSGEARWHQEKSEESRWHLDHPEVE